MIPKDEHKTVLFAPLNWGLGHATRIVPLIQKYIHAGWDVIWVAEGVAYHFLEQEFPSLKHYQSDSLELKYSSKASLFGHLFKLLPRFLKNIRKDQKWLQEFAKKHKIDLIISDNRYGFYHSDIKSVILTHQVQLPLNGWLKTIGFIAQKQVYKWLNRFDECWIVDDAQQTYAGKLSSPKGLKIPYQYTGLLSRMKKEDIEKDIDILIILSGLEPQRSILEYQLLDLLSKSTQNIVFIGGNPQMSEADKNTVQYFRFADTSTLNKLINRSRLVICRSGYSSVMDLIKLNQKAILIPTPGQYEQIYLADLHSQSPLFTSVRLVDELDL